MSRNPFSPPSGSIQDVVSGLVIVAALVVAVVWCALVTI
jgi:hypothetical protein